MARKQASPTPSASTFPFRVIVPVASYRKFPDPVHNTLYHHTGYIPALLYPDTGFPNSENIRPANIDRQIYRAIADSLKNIDCTPNLYHLKSKGELHVASQIRELPANEAAEWFVKHLHPFVPDTTSYEEFQRKYKLIEILYEEGCGIIDGGHTDRIWSDSDNRQAIRDSFADSDGSGRNLNHLGVEWLVGVSDAWLPEVVGGRNTGLQVQEKTLANHEGKFEWLKHLLAQELYGDLIAFRENEPRATKPVDIRDVIALVAPYNRNLYTLEDEPGKKLPLAAFSSKAAVLDDYITDMDDKKDPKDPKRGALSFPKLAPILPDILALHDLIHRQGKDLYNAKVPGGKGGKLDFLDHRDPAKKQKLHHFPFTGTNGADRLADGALYPILAAFSALVTTGRDGNFMWKTPDGFAGVKRIWGELGGAFMEATKAQNHRVGYNAAVVGKTANTGNSCTSRSRSKSADPPRRKAAAV